MCTIVNPSKGCDGHFAWNSNISCKMSNVCYIALVIILDNSDCCVRYYYCTYFELN